MYLIGELCLVRFVSVKAFLHETWGWPELLSGWGCSASRVVATCTMAPSETRVKTGYATNWAVGHLPGTTSRALEFPGVFWPGMMSREPPPDCALRLTQPLRALWAAGLVGIWCRSTEQRSGVCICSGVCVIFDIVPHRRRDFLTSGTQLEGASSQLGRFCSSSSGRPCSKQAIGIYIQLNSVGCRDYSCSCSASTDTAEAPDPLTLAELLCQLTQWQAFH